MKKTNKQFTPEQTAEFKAKRANETEFYKKRRAVTYTIRARSEGLPVAINNVTGERHDYYHAKRCLMPYNSLQL